VIPDVPEHRAGALVQYVQYKSHTVNRLQSAQVVMQISQFVGQKERPVDSGQLCVHIYGDDDVPPRNQHLASLAR